MNKEIKILNYIKQNNGMVQTRDIVKEFEELTPKTISRTLTFLKKTDKVYKNGNKFFIKENDEI
jgi:Fe2+ or Zn2+ uptake regulation protein